MDITKTIAIVVTYKPDILAFKRNILQIRKNFSKVLIINNDLSLDLTSFHYKNVLLINNNLNLGLSASFNIGIKKAKELGFKTICLFDQDSYIPNDFNNLMHLNIKNFKKKFPRKKIAVFSSLFKYSNTGKLSQIYNVSFLRFSHKPHNQSSSYQFADWSISSGSYISIETLDKVGDFDENLFIDYVDVEWCLRARKKRYKCIIFNNIYFTHDLGDGYKNFFNITLYTHQPFRVYYMVRNSIYLFKLKHISFNFFLTDQVRNILKILAYLLIDLTNAGKLLRYTLIGIYHAVIGKMGKLEE